MSKDKEITKIEDLSELMNTGGPYDPSSATSSYAPAKTKKRKKRKRRKKHPILAFFIFCALVTGAVFFIRSDFFTITKIEISGNRYYTPAQVIEISGLTTGYNLFEVELKPARNLLLDDPYIRRADIKRIPMGKIAIDIEERVEYAAVPYAEEYILIDNEGYVLRKTENLPALPLLEGMSIVDITEGSPLEVEQAYLLTDTLRLLGMIEDQDLYFKKIYFSTVIVRAYIYDNYYCEGTPQNIMDNLDGIRQLLEEHYRQNVTKGVIKVGKGNYLAFDPSFN